MHIQSITNSDGEEIHCICCGRDDGWELVQCDDCIALMNGLTNSECTFVLVEEESPLYPWHDFYETLQESPAIMDWQFPHLNGPGRTTPKTSHMIAIDVYMCLSMGSQNGPQTSCNSSATTGCIPIYMTLRSDERIDVSPFDPVSTLSCSVCFGASISSVFAMPKWQICVPPMYASSLYCNGTDPGRDGSGGSSSGGAVVIKSVACGIKCKVFGVKIASGECMPPQDLTAGTRSRREWQCSASDG